MKSVPSNDRPKEIAVAIGIVVALGFVARNVIGVQTAAAPQPKPSAGATASVAPNVANGSRADAEPASTPAARTAMADANLVLPAKLSDPFHAVAQVPTAKAPAAMPVAAAPTRATRDGASPGPLDTGLLTLAPAVASAPVAAGRISAAAPPAAVLAPDRSAGRRPSPTGLPAPTAPLAVTKQMAECEVAGMPGAQANGGGLVGTVGEGDDAVVIFRGPDRASYLRAGDVVNRWRVTGIRVGSVALSHNQHQRQLRVGEPLPPVP